ncbi:LysR family transcriptional regulator substrate-binding protein [Komagataeibacter kakiaceti]|uniref:LysR family transcriptional regulator substrate-binding protein n=1 Tax=Komagataeibacter kakiaceti TaxID=943261 RepID=UPI0006847632|nr:LysR family transcriptional regulator substrate-binding protein [Komagataeibacter kakiaceti]
MQGLRHGSITIGVVESVARGVLPAVLSQFWASAPDVNVDIKVLGSEQILAAIQDGACDLGIAFDAPHEPGRLDRLAVVSLPIGVIMSPRHRLARRKRLRMADLAAERILGPDTGLTINNLLHAGQGAEPVASPRMATNSIASWPISPHAGRASLSRPVSGWNTNCVKRRLSSCPFMPAVSGRVPSGFTCVPGCCCPPRHYYCQI